MLQGIFTHLLIVTVGILIALSLELALEARTNIISEIRASEKDLDSLLKAVLHFVQDMLTHGKSGTPIPHLSLKLAELSNTSWATSQTVGALAFMPYAEVKSFAAVYQLQDEYLRLRVRTEDSVVAALSLFAVNKDPNGLSRAELDAEKERVPNSLSSPTAESRLVSS